MSSAIESTIKALVEFESELDRAKADAMDAKKKLVKEATDWAASAKTKAIAEAQRMASDHVAKARAEAEAEAAAIKKNGAKSLKDFEENIGEHKSKAVEKVTTMLLGSDS